MKAESTIKEEIRKLRALIDSDELDEKTQDMAYGAEHALRWVVLTGHDRTFAPHVYFGVEETDV